MWIIIFIELITFGIALIAFVYNGQEEPDMFSESRKLLNINYGAINTLFLLTSGYFMAKFVGAVKGRKIKMATSYLRYSIIGGLLFLGLKGIEYYEKLEAGYTIDFNTFFTYYWMLTLFHVIHVVVGLVILGSLLIGIRRNKKELLLEDVEASAAFWHMCDLIWLLLFPIIYLLN